MSPEVNLFAKLQSFQSACTSLAKATNADEKTTIIDEHSDVIKPEDYKNGINLMSPESASSEDGYNNGISLFASDEIATRDANNDGKINLNEYLNSNLKTKKDATEEEKAEELSTSHFLFALIDTDHSQEVQAEELEAFYKEMDAFVNGELKEANGNISREEVTSYTEALINKFYSLEDQEQLKNTYLNLLQQQ